jgi:hypothetical protein
MSHLLYALLKQSYYMVVVEGVLHLVVIIAHPHQAHLAQVRSL